MCLGVCRNYRYFGVESGDECFCGDELYGVDGNEIGLGKRDDSECTTRCSGESGFCGDHWKMNLYKISPFSDDYQVAGHTSGCTSMEGSQITSGDDCEAACNSLGVEFSSGSWSHSPGCFYYDGNPANVQCHWNTRTDGQWNQ